MAATMSPDIEHELTFADMVAYWLSPAAETDAE